ncbi:penicillin-binding protein [Candidatus Gottesmanbacteria bacterium]|nr:penicillin-binding protein [Candidatus Gottesmanbacteria bacterium]
MPKNSKNKMPSMLDVVMTLVVVVLFLLTKLGDGIIFVVKTLFTTLINSLEYIGLFFVSITSKLLIATINSLKRIKIPVKNYAIEVKKSRRFSRDPDPKASGKKRRRFRFLKIRFSFISFILGIALTFIFVLIPYNMYVFVKSLPNPKLLKENHFPVTTKIFDRNGVLLYEIFSDENRTPVKLSEVPKSVIDATIAIEDKEFYYHYGFSVRGITRSLRSIALEKEIQGGSTITQQLIKSALLSPFWAERIYSKDQILEMYLNQVPYGGTAWGIQAAARNYFDKDVADLTFAESALLAGLPAAPSYYSPFGAHPELALSRKDQVLDSMLTAGKISREELEAAKTQQLVFAKQVTDIKAPHFVMWVKSLLEEKYGVRRVEQGGLRVTSSLDITLQDKVQEIVSNNVDGLSNLLVGNGAALVTNPKNGEILAMVGSRDYFDMPKSGNVNVTTSLQQPGSSIKVVTYATALENGFTPATLIDDSPVSYQLPNQPAYRPVNYDGKFHGYVTLRRALGNSYNVPAVKTIARVGVDNVVNYGRNMGIESWDDSSRFGLSLTLGAAETTMLDMAKVYGTMANNGNYQQLTPILKVTTYEGNTIEVAKIGKTKQVLKPQTAFLLSNILSDNNARSDAFGSNSKLVIPGKTVAVKTGTSNDKRDNWTIGYTPSYVTTVWVGNNDNTPMHPTLTSGITGATPIWNEIITYLLVSKADEKFARPGGITELSCYGHTEYFVEGTQPAGGCPPIPTPSPSSVSPTPTP